MFGPLWTDASESELQGGETENSDYLLGHFLFWQNALDTPTKNDTTSKAEELANLVEKWYDLFVRVKKDQKKELANEWYTDTMFQLWCVALGVDFKYVNNIKDSIMSSNNRAFYGRISSFFLEPGENKTYNHTDICRYLPMKINTNKKTKNLKLPPLKEFGLIIITLGTSRQGKTWTLQCLEWQSGH